jgi:hypothetical protein
MNNFNVDNPLPSVIAIDFTESLLYNWPDLSHKWLVRSKLVAREHITKVKVLEFHAFCTFYQRFSNIILL